MRVSLAPIRNLGAEPAPLPLLDGQRRFSDTGDNRWAAVARDSVCWPYAIASCATTAIIADSGNNRVLLWEAV